MENVKVIIWGLGAMGGGMADMLLKKQGVDQAPLSMGFSRQEYWWGLPVPSPGNLLNPGIKPVSPVSPTFAGGFFTAEPPGKPIFPFTAPCK